MRIAAGIASCLSLLLCVAACDAQTLHTSFTIAAGQPARRTRDNTANKLRSSLRPTVEAGIGYRFLLARRMSVIADFRVTATGRNATFKVPFDFFNPGAYPDSYPHITYNQYDFGIAIPLLFEWRFPLVEKMWLVQAGASVRMMLGPDADRAGFSFEDSAGRYVQVLNIAVNANNSRKPWITWHLNIGHTWTLGNDHNMAILLVSNISHSFPVSGEYSITIPNYADTYGTYKVNGSYLGFTFIYDLKK